MRAYFTIMTICLVSLGFSHDAFSASNLNYYAPTAEYTSLKGIEKFHLQQAVAKIKDHKFNFAWNELAYVLHYIPNHPLALQLLGTLSFEMKKDHQAKAYFERAIHLFPQVATTYVLYGKFLEQAGEPEKALLQFHQAIALNEKEAEYYYHLGLVYYRLKQYEQANEVAQTAYQQGFSDPYLKEQLISVQAWKEMNKA